MRTAAKVDANQGGVVKALRGVGADVQQIHAIGKGCPDLLVAFRGQWFVAELKDGAKPPSERKLTPHEEAWHERFNHHAPVQIWETEEDALRGIGAIE